MISIQAARQTGEPAPLNPRALLQRQLRVAHALLDAAIETFPNHPRRRPQYGAAAIVRYAHAQNLVRREFHSIASRAKLPRIRFHDLRHTHATHMLQQGVNLKVIQERLGHSNPAFTLAVWATSSPGCRKRRPGWSRKGCWGREPEARISRD